MIRLFLAVALLGLALPIQAATYAVVIGIDDYAHFSDLEGAVNDAEDIASVIRGRGGDVMLITDQQATRSNIVNAFRTQAAKASDGDVLILTYAGHGVQLPESLIGDEVDGMDENFVLHGFAEAGPGVGERLRDNDLASLFMEVPDGVTVLFVADSCHSGTMTRLPFEGAELGKTRFLELGPIEEDPLPAPEERSFQIDGSGLPHVVFAAAARDNEQTPEVLIDGERRGALSWSIARALEGVADGGDGQTTMTDLREFVRASVRGFSGARQTPDVVFEIGSRETDNLSTLLSPAGKDQEVESEAVPPKPARPLAPGPTPALFILGEATADLTALSDVAEQVEDEEQAALVWNVAEKRLVDRVSADLIAEVNSPADVAAAITSWRAIFGLVRWTPTRAFEMRLQEGDQRHMLGQKVTILVSPASAGPAKGHLTLVNLASGGEVQYIYPSEKSVEKGKDVIDRGADDKTFGPSKVSEPVGKDTLIGVITASPPKELRSALRSLNGQAAPEKVLALLQTHASDPETARLSVLPIHTARP
ncbi:MAG: caspase family protein [Pseudomonadota bacterium]